MSLISSLSKMDPHQWTRPDREGVATLELLSCLDSGRIHLVASEEDAQMARERLCSTRVVGFDSESRPTFFPGEVSAGPHVIQFATRAEAFILQMHHPMARALAAELLCNEELVKLGFGLDGDRAQIRRSLGVEPAALVDLNTVFRRLGHGASIGARAAIAMIYGRRLVKSKKITTSNWAAENLSDAQIHYAANDAWAAMCVWPALGLELDEVVEAGQEIPSTKVPRRPRSPRARSRRRGRGREVSPGWDAVDHVHLSVADRAAAQAWYAEVLGMDVVPDLLPWAEEGGPLTLEDRRHRLHLALFERAPQGRASVVALRCSPDALIAWRERLAQHVSPVEFVDHGLAVSLYFEDPWGNPFEFTTYRVDELREKLNPPVVEGE
jgi:catechol 2,3-dioxygenase-like lactoylglutathione lyase family enzyme